MRLTLRMSCGLLALSTGISASSGPWTYTLTRDTALGERNPRIRLACFTRCNRRMIRVEFIQSCGALWKSATRVKRI